MASPRSLDEIVTEQVRRWERERGRDAPVWPAPSIALSRLPGSAAAELGQRVAERLGFGFFGIEIVELIARESGARRELVAGLDEHVRGAIDRYLMDTSKGRTFNESAYLERLVRVLATLGERGQAVILGRGSVFVLRPERTLRVLVVAPRPQRLERLAKRHDLPLDQANEVLAQEERERVAFNRHHFHADPDDASVYDLVVNTGTLTVELAAQLIEQAARARFPFLGSKPG